MLNVLAVEVVEVQVKQRHLELQKGVVPVVVVEHYLKDFIPHRICHRRYLLTLRPEVPEPLLQVQILLQPQEVIQHLVQELLY
jgi:hypothetical protein